MAQPSQFGQRSHGVVNRALKLAKVVVAVPILVVTGLVAVVLFGVLTALCLAVYLVESGVRRDGHHVS